MLRLGAREAAEHAIDCLIEAGFKTVEVTLTTPDAIGIIGALRERVAGFFLVGAGTCWISIEPRPAWTRARTTWYRPVWCPEWPIWPRRETALP